MKPSQSHALPGQSSLPSEGGAGTRSPSDAVFQFTKVAGSSIAEDSSGAIQYSVVGIQTYELEILENGQGAKITVGTTDDESESQQDAELYGALGILGRPLPPDQRDGQDTHMEVLCVREQDSLVPIAARDTRIKMGPAAPAEGVVAIAGYGGGFHSLTPVAVGSIPDAGGTIHVLYCPYDFDSNGVAQKAHSIILDPTTGNESILIAHSDGTAVTMSAGNLILKSPSGASTIVLDEDQILMAAPKIVMNAQVFIGNEATAVPLLAGAASPPCSTLAVSP